MSKSKLWRFKTFLIVSMLVLVAVAATPASAVYFSDSFVQVKKVQTETVVDQLFSIPNLISENLSKLIGVNKVELASFGKAQILGKF
ncbi:MAG: hypothetical protein NTZ25_01040 [Candidatus Peregrinibacteria bacterium]|nr:hypothetical protein [Candidatus Peregrinibacteria bacterium]